MSGQAYLEIIQGNNYPPVEWEILDEEDVPIDVSGSTFRLAIVWPRGRLDVNSVSDPELVVGGADGKVTWNYSVATSRMIPLGDGVATYELERRVGSSQQTIVRDKIVCLKGDNPDA